MADITTTTTTSSIGRSYEEYVSARNPKNELGKNSFLQMLAAQLQYQDPLEPMKDTDFIAQMAQFSSLEQMQALNATMTMHQSYSLAGKFVYAEFTNENFEAVEIAGVVDRVVNRGGEAYVQIGDSLVKASQVSEVFDSALFEDKTLQYYNLVGKHASATIEDEEGNKTTVSGRIDRVVNEAGVCYAIIEGKKVHASLIASVWDGGPGSSAGLLDHSGLIGKQVSATRTNEYGEPTSLTGLVTGVSLEDGKVVAHLGDGQKVSVLDITDIRLA